MPYCGEVVHLLKGIFAQLGKLEAFDFSRVRVHDKDAARETLNRVREFISNHATVYLSTHTPLGYENLESKKVIDLNNPPATIPVGEVVYKTATGKYVCSICGYVYDPEIGDPEGGVPAGTRFEDLPEGWHCPRCKQGNDKFNKA